MGKKSMMQNLNLILDEFCEIFLERQKLNQRHLKKNKRKKRLKKYLLSLIEKEIFNPEFSFEFSFAILAILPRVLKLPKIELLLLEPVNPPKEFNKPPLLFFLLLNNITKEGHEYSEYKDNVGISWN